MSVPPRLSVNAGPAIVSSIRTVMRRSRTSFTAATGGPGAERHVVFQLENFNPRVHFEAGWWSGTAIANAELAMRITVYDANSQETNRAVVAGSGYGELDGDCDARQLEVAVNQAIKTTIKNYVSRMINGEAI
jgi:hypothetical protein